MLTIDDPRTTQLLAAVRDHLVARCLPAALQQDVEAIEALDGQASPTLRATLGQLLAEIDHRVTAQRQADPALVMSDASGRPAPHHNTRGPRPPR